MSITGVELTLCSFDDQPISESRIYQDILNLHGQEIADQFSFEYCVEFGSDELKSVVDIVTGGIPPTGMRGFTAEEAAIHQEGLRKLFKPTGKRRIQL